MVTVTGSQAFCESCDAGGGRTAQLSVWCGDAQVLPIKAHLCIGCLKGMLGEIRAWLELAPPSTLT